MTGKLNDLTIKQLLDQKKTFDLHNICVFNWIWVIKQSSRSILNKLQQLVKNAK